MVGPPQVLEHPFGLAVRELGGLHGERQQEVRLARCTHGVAAYAHRDGSACSRDAGRLGRRPVHREGQGLGREGPEGGICVRGGKEQADVGADESCGGAEELRGLLVGEQHAPGAVKDEHGLAGELQQL